MKKIFLPLIYCALPTISVAAMPVELVIDSNGHIDNIITSDSVSYRLSDANSLDGFVVDNDVNIVGILSVWGDGVTPAGDLFIVPGAGTKTSDFTIRVGSSFAAGDLIVYGNNGRGIAIDSINATDKISASFGAISNQDKLSLSGVGAFVVGGNDALGDNNGRINNTGIMSVDAGTVTVGAITSTGTNMTINATGNITSNGRVYNDSGTMNIASMGGDVMLRGIENRGTMNVDAGADIGIGTDVGDINNISIANYGNGTLTIDGGDVTVWGFIKNDSNAGTINLTNLSELSVYRGTAIDASFVNKGNAIINVDGRVSVAGGFDLSSMAADNTFSLTADTFQNLQDTATGLFANQNNSRTITVLSGAIGDSDYDTIYNGANNNTAANMDITASSVNAASVTNAGQNLNIIATSTDTSLANAINIVGAVAASRGTTKIASADTLSAGAVTTGADSILNINARDINVASVVNSGATNIVGFAGGAGDASDVFAADTVTNISGNMQINTRDIEITDSLINRGGNTTVQGATSNSIINSIYVAGGNLTLNSMAGGVSGDGAMMVGWDSDGVTTTGTGIGVMNIAGTSGTSGATYNMAFSTIDIARDFIVGATSNSGNGDVYSMVSGASGLTLSSTATDGHINIGRNVTSVSSNGYKTVFDAKSIDVGGAVRAQNAGNTIVFGASESSNTHVGGTMYVYDGGVVEMNSYATILDSSLGVDDGGKLVARGVSVVANDDITIANGVDFIGASVSPATRSSGMVVAGDENTYTIRSQSGSVSLGNDVVVAESRNLIINAENGNVGVDGKTTVDGALTIASGASGGTTTLTGAVQNNGDMTLSGALVTATTGITMAGNALNVTTDDFSAGLLKLNSGKTNLVTPKTTIDGVLTVNGTVSQGDDTNIATLNIVGDSVVSASSIDINGTFDADANSVKYVATNDIDIDNKLTIGTNAISEFSAPTLKFADVENRGYMILSNATTPIVANNFVVNNGLVEINSGTGLSVADNLTVADTIYQKYTSGQIGTPAGAINVMPDNFTIAANTMQLNTIRQNDGAMTLRAHDLTIDGGLADANDVTIAALDPQNGQWLNATINGKVSGNVSFLDLERLVINNGDYVFGDTSRISAVVLPGANFADVNTTADNTFGQISNRAGATPIITINNGTFVYNASDTGAEISAGDALPAPQIGINLFDAINSDTAIWLVHTDNAIDSASRANDTIKIRDMYVNFCNNNGTECVRILDMTNANNADDSDLPAYLSLRDMDGDGISNDIYVVFDSNYGGPLYISKIQPIVDRVPGHTDGQHAGAGAVDDLVDAQLAAHGFPSNAPIAVLTTVMTGTPFETLGNELYNRLEQYSVAFDGTPLANFSRLFQNRELKQLNSSIALDEHTFWRNIEDHMIDEFIWNRHRNLRKLWVDVDYGMFNMDANDGPNADGTRLGVTAGYDWQASNTLILGVAGRFAHIDGNNTDNIDLSYQVGKQINGRVSSDVDTTSFGIGAYLMKTFGTKWRGYGNAFVDVNMLNISRTQEYVDGAIKGDGTSVSLISEWGLIHDWLNQYIVGNLYARVGYNTGFKITEQVDGNDYMDLKSDGYAILTPGYSITAQKRIYPSVWFQIRPYASAGVEYDVLGSPDTAKYKFASSARYAEYDIEINPLWVYAGAGVEMLSANGIQVGLDYRYQYNETIQMHNIKISGSYRF